MSAPKIRSYEERRQAMETTSTIALFGLPGCGKTTLTMTLDPNRTVFVNVENGDKAIQDFPCQELTIETHEQMCDFAVWVGGPNKSVPADAPFGYYHALRVFQDWGDPQEKIGGFDTMVLDTITEITSIARRYHEANPACLAKSGKVDGFAVWRNVAQDSEEIFRAFQRCPLNIVLIGHMKATTDAFGQTHYEPDIPGKATGTRLDRIFDVVITLSQIAMPDGSLPRVIVCREDNPFGFPAKDRSGCLDMYESPHLGEILRKVNSGERVRQFEMTDINYVRAVMNGQQQPAAPATDEAPAQEAHSSDQAA